MKEKNELIVFVMQCVGVRNDDCVYWIVLQNVHKALVTKNYLYFPTVHSIKASLEMFLSF